VRVDVMFRNKLQYIRGKCYFVGAVHTPAFSQEPRK